MPSPHMLNILIHVSAGTVTILLGLIILSRRKGDRWHVRLGRAAVASASISVATALLGAFVFRAKFDLMGASLLVGYHLWAGLRALSLKDRGRRLADLAPALGVVVGGGGLWAIYRYGAPVNWSPGLVMGTIGGMLTYGGYDVMRTLYPAGWRTALNPAEHAFRMVSVIGAMISVAVGALVRTNYTLPLPLIVSAVFGVAGLVFAVRAARKALGVVPSVALKARLNADSEL